MNHHVICAFKFASATPVCTIAWWNEDWRHVTQALVTLLTKMTLFQCLYIEKRKQSKRKINGYHSCLALRLLRKSYMQISGFGAPNQARPRPCHPKSWNKRREKEKKKMQMPDSPNIPKTTASNKDPYQKKNKGGSGRKKEKKSEEMRERETTPSPTPGNQWTMMALGNEYCSTMQAKCRPPPRFQNSI